MDSNLVIQLQELKNKCHAEKKGKKENDKKKEMCTRTNRNYRSNLHYRIRAVRSLNGNKWCIIDDSDSSYRWRSWIDYPITTDTQIINLEDGRKKEENTGRT